MKRLAIISTHPIQYNAPLFALLASRGNIAVKIFYTWGAEVLEDKFDPGFGKNIKWDIPLLDGYEYCFVENKSARPGSHHFYGMVNPTLNKEIELWNATAVLVFGWAFSGHLRCIRHFYKKLPVLFRGDSTILRNQGTLKLGLRKLFLKWVYGHIDYSLYVGRENRRYYEVVGIKDKQLVYAPHAIDNSRFADNKNEYEKAAVLWRSNLGIQPEELTILYAGKLEDIKDPFFLVELAKGVADKPVRFVIVGNGPLERSFKETTAGNSKFVFLDFQNQLTMPIVYRVGDLFILPSKSETWGLGVNEAMACGRGVLVRDTCGCAVDLVANGINGYIFNSESKNQLIEKIGRLVIQKEQVKEMGKASLKKIQGYTFEHIVKAIESLM